MCVTVGSVDFQWHLGKFQRICRGYFRELQRGPKGFPRVFGDISGSFRGFSGDSGITGDSEGLRCVTVGSRGFQGIFG